MVVGVGAGLTEPLGLSLLKQPKTDAHLHFRGGVLDRGDHVGDALDITIGGPAAGGNQADAFGACIDRALRVAGGLVGVDPGVLEDLSARPEPLRPISCSPGS